MTTTNMSFDAPTPPSGGYPAPPAPQPTRRRRGTAAIVIGAVIAGTGFLTAASGAALLGLFGAGQVVSSGEHPISTSTSALVTDLGQIEGINGFDILTGSPTLHISAESIGENGVFVGVGPTEQVERYLEGVATDTVTDLDLAPFRIDTVRTDGTVIAQPPAEQSFWVASSESSVEAQVTWQIEDGRYEIVVMNADGTPGVLTSGEIGASLPSSSAIWVLVLSIGVLLMIGGGILIVVGIRQE
jgi:hypothetical protein